MNTVLLHIHDDIGQHARLEGALALARVLPAHIVCVQPVDGGAPVASVLVPPSIAEAAFERQMAGPHSAADTQRGELEIDLAFAGVSYEWRRHDGTAGDAMRRFAPLADVAILSLAPSKILRPAPQSLAVEVALHLDVPVFAMPTGLKSFEPASPIIVAWDGSQPAAAALRASLPLLRLASRVMILSINEANDVLPTAAEAAAYLARGGVTADTCTTRNAADVGLAMLDCADDIEACCIVMGMYGHSRARELVFGGVTSSLLSKDALPLFLGH